MKEYDLTKFSGAKFDNLLKNVLNLLDKSSDRLVGTDFKGVLRLDEEIPTPKDSQSLSYLLIDAGVYLNSFELLDGCIGLLSWDGSKWSFSQSPYVNVMTDDQYDALKVKVKSQLYFTHD